MKSVPVDTGFRDSFEAVIRRGFKQAAEAAGVLLGTTTDFEAYYSFEFRSHRNPELMSVTLLPKRFEKAERSSRNAPPETLLPWVRSSRNASCSRNALSRNANFLAVEDWGRRVMWESSLSLLVVCAKVRLTNLLQPPTLEVGDPFPRSEGSGKGRWGWRCGSGVRGVERGGAGFWRGWRGGCWRSILQIWGCSIEPYHIVSRFFASFQKSSRRCRLVTSCAARGPIISIFSVS